MAGSTKCHGYLEFVGGRNPRDRGRERIESSPEGDDPVVLTEVVQRFGEVGVLQTYTRRELPGPVRCEDAVSLIGEQPDQLDADQRLLGLCANSQCIYSRFTSGRESVPLENLQRHLDNVKGTVLLS